MRNSLSKSYKDSLYFNLGVTESIRGCSLYYPIIYDIIFLDSRILLYAYSTTSIYYTEMLYTDIQDAFEKICFELESFEFEFFKF